MMKKSVREEVSKKLGTNTLGSEIVIKISLVAFAFVATKIVMAFIGLA